MMGMEHESDISLYYAYDVNNIWSVTFSYLKNIYEVIWKKELSQIGKNLTIP